MFPENDNKYFGPKFSYVKKYADFKSDIRMIGSLLIQSLRAFRRPPPPPRSLAPAGGGWGTAGGTAAGRPHYAGRPQEPLGTGRGPHFRSFPAFGKFSGLFFFRLRRSRPSFFLNFDAKSGESGLGTPS